MNATFEKSVAILEKAYRDNVLEPMTCAACACGNLLAGYNGFNVIRIRGTLISSYHWDTDFDTYGIWSLYASNYEVESRHMAYIDKMGYSPEHLNAIEKAFMFGDNIDDDGYEEDGKFCGIHSQWSHYPIKSSFGERPDDLTFAALMRVIDVLAVIHGVDLTISTKAKAEFALAD